MIDSPTVALSVITTIVMTLLVIRVYDWLTWDRFA